MTHIAEHNISPEEVEQVLAGPTFLVDRDDWNGEERISEVGVTFDGRFLYVVSTLREHGIRVVTAYEPPKRLIAEYLSNR